MLYNVLYYQYNITDSLSTTISQQNDPCLTAGFMLLPNILQVFVNLKLNLGNGIYGSSPHM